MKFLLSIFFRNWRPYGYYPSTTMRRFVNGAWEYRELTPAEKAEDQWHWCLR